MSEARTPEENARIILSVFKASNVKAGHVLMAGAIKHQTDKAGVKASEFIEGLEYAGKQGWVQTTDNTSLRLTAAGFSEL